jgi:hypothetical protein
LNYEPVRVWHVAIIQCAFQIDALLLAHFENADSGSRPGGHLS